jgi:hypothetical protein
MAEELKNRLKNDVVLINQNVADADIYYYIDYSHFQRSSTAIDAGWFTHFEPGAEGDLWKSKVLELDHCIVPSFYSRDVLHNQGFPAENISVVRHCADQSFRPKVRLGIVGRTYPSGRKGEHLVKALIEDPEIARIASIVAKHEGWGVPVNDLDYTEFYHSIDFLLIPSLVEAGPVPFIEALACGKLAIAPPIGNVPEFEHIEYKTGDLDDLKRVILETCRPIYEERYQRSLQVKQYDWAYWAAEHERVFNELHRKFINNGQRKQKIPGAIEPSPTDGSALGRHVPAALKETSLYKFCRFIYHAVKSRLISK